MPGLDPGIHSETEENLHRYGMDRRIKSGETTSNEFEILERGVW